MKSVVVLSGGQDSTTCLYWARSRHHDNVAAITFDYGQNHKVEVECSKEICRLTNTPQTIVKMDFLNDIIESEMLKGGDTSKINEKGLPSSFVPNRNALFLTLSHAFAQKLKAIELVAGMCETDYSGYPDCRATFITSLGEVLNQGSDSKILIYAPLMYKSKAETFKLAERLQCLNEVLKYSHTCYKGDRNHWNDWGYGCGTCPACLLREKGWKEFKGIK